MTNLELLEEVQGAVLTLTNKVQASVAIGKPLEACDYAAALASTMSAYCELQITARDTDDD